MEGENKANELCYGATEKIFKKKGRWWKTGLPLVGQPSRISVFWGFLTQQQEIKNESKQNFKAEKLFALMKIVVLDPYFGFSFFHKFK